MAEDSSNNVINNYKGVMLCSRPNEKKSADYDKPFCGRVVPGEQLGLNPIKKDTPQDDKPAHKHNTALEKHKKWLSEFKGGIQKTKEELDEKARKEQQKFRKIREQAEADRERARKMKEEYNQTATQVLNVLDEKTPPAPGPSGELTADNLRKLDALNERKQKPDFRKKAEKGEKPVWAMTKEQVEENQEQEVDELLDFFQSNNVNDFSQDQEVKELLSSLKHKIEKMKETDDWREKEVQRIKEQKEERQGQAPEDDKYSQFSAGNSEGKSVASEKTQKKIEELRQKKAQQQEWDKFTTSQKSSLANVDERIAKNIADQVLRNYPNLKGVHSNVSIRRLLQAQAAKVINEPIIRPVITTIVKEKQPINANTLPYLHRNPAI